MEPTVIDSFVRSPAFSFDGREYLVADCIVEGLRAGEWQPFAARLAAGRAATANGQAPERDRLAATAAAFRRERRLLAADDLARWLADRNLTTEDWRAWLARAVLRGEAEEAPAVDVDHETLRVDALCEGVLERWAGAIVSLEARALAAPIDVDSVAPPQGRIEELTLACPVVVRALRDLDERLARLARLEAAAQRFDAQAASGAALAKYLDDHRLEWARLAWEEVGFEREGAAREAALLVREDGIPLGDVAGLVGKELTTSAAFLNEIEPARRSLLVAAQPGELVGPVVLPSGWSLLLVRERRAPSLEEPAVAEAARQAITAAAIERYAAGRVTWHGAI